MHSYALVSNGTAFGAAPPASGSGAGAESAITGAATFSFSATRRVRVRNSISVRKAITAPGSGACTSRSSSVTSSATSRFSVTSWREMRIRSALSSSDSRRLGCVISPARASSVSRSPYSLISSAAVFSPIPGAPGTLSTESPDRACTSTTRSGPTPNFSNTSSRSMRRSFIGSRITTPLPTSCIRSLSEEMMVTLPPAATAC